MGSTSETEVEQVLRGRTNVSGTSATPVTSLIHNGVLIPAYEPKGLAIRYRDKSLRLAPEQEEMAVAFAKHLDKRAGDSVFVRNFLKDFTGALGISDQTRLEDFDFSRILNWLEAERARREGMTLEERKALAARRKQERELNRERYGYALVNGERVEVANYAVEPPCIFIGRGKHPLRGRWKPRVRYDEVVLNLSPDAPEPRPSEGICWGGREFDPKGLWIAKWRDKLAGKIKYVWIAESSQSRQEREREKFDRAQRLGRSIEKVRLRIEDGLVSDDPFERKVATACYLIDRLRLRVGDEKDPDELDTFGVTTLRKRHIKIAESGDVKFDFLGKGGVRLRTAVKLPPRVVENLRLFIQGSGAEIFSRVRSEHVNAFFAQVMPGLTAKVFRTYHASNITGRRLVELKVQPEDSDFVKLYAARIANLEVARTCNHRRGVPKNWKVGFEKKVNRLKGLEAKLGEAKMKPRTRGRAKQMRSLRRRAREARLKVKLARATKSYNLGTSLRSYIDPRVYVRWANGVSYDWRNVYPKSLQQKFAWAEVQS